jgi:hypothetical protein
MEKERLPYGSAVRQLLPDLRTVFGISRNQLVLYATPLMPPEAIRRDWIIDEPREAEKVSVWDNAAGYMEAVTRSYLRDNWQDQPNYCEVWCEKATVLESLRPVTQNYGVMLRVCRGFGLTGMGSKSRICSRGFRSRSRSSTWVIMIRAATTSSAIFTAEPG